MKTDFREFHPYNFIHEWKRVGLLVVILFVAPLSYFLMEWSLDSSDYGIFKLLVIVMFIVFIANVVIF